MPLVNNYLQQFGPQSKFLFEKLEKLISEQSRGLGYAAHAVSNISIVTLRIHRRLARAGNLVRE